MGLKAFDSANRTSSDLSLTSTSWANLDTGLDLTMPTEVGDLIEVGMVGLHDDGGASDATYVDVVSLVSGSPVNSWSRDAAPTAGHNGTMCWRGQGGEQHTLGGSVTRKVVSGDLSAGVLTLRFRYKVASGTKTLFATANNPTQVWAKNHGPV